MQLPTPTTLLLTLLATTTSFTLASPLGPITNNAIDTREALDTPPPPRPRIPNPWPDKEEAEKFRLELLQNALGPVVTPESHHFTRRQNWDWRRRHGVVGEYEDGMLKCEYPGGTIGQITAPCPTAYQEADEWAERHKHDKKFRKVKGGKKLNVITIEGERIE